MRSKTTWIIVIAALVLDIKDHSYFTERNAPNEHGGGGLFAYDEEIMGWLFAH